MDAAGTRDEDSSAAAVIIIGAGPAGVATAACLSFLSIPFLILERENCIASLWRHRTYNRLKLHLAKRFCQLPHMPPPADSPTYMPKDRFIKYLDEYAAKFNVLPEFGLNVESAAFREGDGKWVVKVRRRENGEEREYVGRYLVVATGENGEPHVPKIEGIEGFNGDLIHSADYKNGSKYKGKRVLVVGSGNSGMEIAFDLCSHGAVTSICVRGELQVMNKEMVHFGMLLLKYNMPLPIVDSVLILLSKLKYGDLSKFGINKPKDGPFFLKATVGKSPVIDVGTIHKIKNGEIQVLPAISFIEGDSVKFTDGESHYFDTILFATGYKSLANKWLKDEKNFLNEKGLPARKFPNHWKGENGIYSAGMSRRGLEGIASDARLISNDIDMILKSKRSMTKPSYEAYREAKTVFPYKGLSYDEQAKSSCSDEILL